MALAPAPTLGLSADQLSQYRTDGFLVVRQAFTPAEIQELGEEANRLWWRKDLIDVKNLRCRWKNHVATGECTFECFDPVADIGPACCRIAHDPRITDRLAGIYGEQ